jgi:hypothetical protein
MEIESQSCHESLKFNHKKKVNFVDNSVEIDKDSDFSY